jgi:O-antigen ligase
MNSRTHLETPAAVAPRLVAFSTILVAAILVLIPFHAFLSVWVGGSLGIYDGARIWKEIILLVLLVPASYLLWKGMASGKRPSTGPVFWLVVGYVGLHGIAGLVAYGAKQVNAEALWYGLTVNLRFLLFFVCCAVVASYSPWLRAHWQKLVFIPAGLVVGFGLLQIFVLPPDILAHFGYGPDTIVPYQTVDQKQAYVRVQSTMRGPNPLAAYLVVVIAAAVAVLARQRQARWAYRGLVALLAGSTVVLGFTYSRSGYIGAVIAVGVACWLLAQNARLRRWLLIIVAGVVLLGGCLVWVLRQNDSVQNVLFHTNEHSAAPRSSNQDRAAALQSGLGDLAQQPLGQGPGTAGPASVHNNGKVRIAENYYLQIGQEVGWIGIVLFVAILTAVGWELLKRRPEALAVCLCASLVGISIINLLSHAWTDDTLSLLWWGLAGIVASPAILNSTRNDVR